MTGNKAIFDPLANKYDAWFDAEGKLIFETEVRAFREASPLLPEPWLEIGVGSGRFAQALGIKTGIDPSAKLLEMARNRGITGYLGRGEAMPFDAESFGTAFLIVTFCFLDTPAEVLREAHRVLKDKGRLVLGVVLRESPWGQHYMKKKAEGHRFYKYAHFFSYQEVVDILQPSNFAIEKTISTLFQKPEQVSKVEPPREHFHPDAGFTIIIAKKTLS